MSEKTFKLKYPKGAIPKKSKDYGKTFICRRGINTKTSTYTDEIVWEDIRHNTEEEVNQLMDFLESATKSTRKRKFEKRTKGDDDFKGGVVDDDELEQELGTPRKKKKTSAVSTPRKPRTPSKLLTPSHKRYMSFPEYPSSTLI